MAKLRVIIDPKGNTKFDVEGVTGKACLNVTDELEKALGTVTERVAKDEYYEDDNQETQSVSQM